MTGWKRAGWLVPLLGPILVAALAPGSARAQLVIRGEAGGMVRDCATGDAQVVARGTHVVIAGACRTLSVFGFGNAIVVDLQPGAVVQITGDHNRIAYRTPAGTPTIAITGHDDIVLPAVGLDLAALPQPPGPLVIPAGGLSGQFACGGRDVFIHASYGHYDLRGGCRSLTVDGTSTTIVAELEPGAVVAVGASNVALNYVLVADGPPPRVRVTVPGEQATHIQRNQGSLLQLPTERALP